jgi:hypothetical protein
MFYKNGILYSPEHSGPNSPAKTSSKRSRRTQSSLASKYIRRLETVLTQETAKRKRVEERVKTASLTNRVKRLEKMVAREASKRHAIEEKLGLRGPGKTE